MCNKAELESWEGQESAHAERHRLGELGVYCYNSPGIRDPRPCLKGR